MVDDYIEDYILPEMILEVINTHNLSKDYSLYNPTWRLLVEVSDGLEATLIHDLCTEVVKDVVRNIVNSYVKERVDDKITRGTFDPLVLLTEKLTAEAVDSLLEPMAK